MSALPVAVTPTKKRSAETMSNASPASASRVRTRSQTRANGGVDDDSAAAASTGDKETDAAQASKRLRVIDESIPLSLNLVVRFGVLSIDIGAEQLIFVTRGTFTRRVNRSEATGVTIASLSLEASQTPKVPGDASDVANATGSPDTYVLVTRSSKEPHTLKVSHKSITTISKLLRGMDRTASELEVYLAIVPDPTTTLFHEIFQPAMSSFLQKMETRREQKEDGGSGPRADELNKLLGGHKQFPESLDASYRTHYKQAILAVLWSPMHIPPNLELEVLLAWRRHYDDYVFLLKRVKIVDADPDPAMAQRRGQDAYRAFLRRYSTLYLDNLDKERVLTKMVALDRFYPFELNDGFLLQQYVDYLTMAVSRCIAGNTNVARAQLTHVMDEISRSARVHLAPRTLSNAVDNGYFASKQELIASILALQLVPIEFTTPEWFAGIYRCWIPGLKSWYGNGPQDESILCPTWAGRRQHLQVAAPALFHAAPANLPRTIGSWIGDDDALRLWLRMHYMLNSDLMPSALNGAIEWAMERLLCSLDSWPTLIGVYLVDIAASPTLIGAPADGTCAIAAHPQPYDKLLTRMFNPSNVTSTHSDWDAFRSSELSGPVTNKTSQIMLVDGAFEPTAEQQLIQAHIERVALARQVETAKLRDWAEECDPDEPRDVCDRAAEVLGRFTPINTSFPKRMASTQHSLVARLVLYFMSAPPATQVLMLSNQHLKNDVNTHIDDDGWVPLSDTSDSYVGSSRGLLDGVFYEFERRQMECMLAWADHALYGMSQTAYHLASAMLLDPAQLSKFSSLQSLAPQIDKSCLFAAQHTLLIDFVMSLDKLITMSEARHTVSKRPTTDLIACTVLSWRNHIEALLERHSYAVNLAVLARPSLLLHNDAFWSKHSNVTRILSLALREQMVHDSLLCAKTDRVVRPQRETVVIEPPRQLQRANQQQRAPVLIQRNGAVRQLQVNMERPQDQDSDSDVEEDAGDVVDMYLRDHDVDEGDAEPNDYRPERRFVPRGGAAVRPLVLTIDRAHLIDSSLAALTTLKFDDLASGFAIKFEGENGIGDGPVQEWMWLVSDYIFSQNDCWVPCEFDTRTFVFNPASTNSLVYEMAGKLHALALLTRTKMKYCLAAHLLRFIMTGGREMQWQDLQYVNKDNHTTIKAIVEMDAEDVESLDMYFEVSSDVQGEPDTELVPGGSQLLLTHANRDEFARAYAQNRLLHGQHAHLQSFLAAFQSLLSVRAVPQHLLTNRELVQYFCGTLKIDVSLLQQLATYEGYTAASPQVQWFWKIFDELTEAQRQVILFFGTASSQIRVRADTVFKLQRSSALDGQAVLSASTCFHTILLPAYDTEGEMRDKIQWMLACPSRYQGFGTR